MKKNSALTKEVFETLLESLAPDRSEAGKKYEEIRLGLIRFFRFRGCLHPDSLADETLNRAAAKVLSFHSAEADNIIRFFYGFAKKIFLEYLSRHAEREVPLDAHSFYLVSDPDDSNSEEKEIEAVCLDQCLNQISPADKSLILDYYNYEKSKKAENRTRLAGRLNMNKGALHTKVFRLRAVLKTCVKKCIKKKICKI